MATTTFSFTLEQAALARVVTAVCENNGYQALINGVPNPETQNQFAKRMTYEWWKAQVIAKQLRDDAASSSDITGT